MPSDSPEIEVVGIDPDPLHAIAYLSTPTVPFEDRDVADLLFAARHWNAIYEITGKLVVLEEGDRVVRFLQWIEGPAPALDACFERIRADTRHDDIEVRFRGAVEARRFPAWDMAIDTATPATFDTEADALAPDRD